MEYTMTQESTYKFAIVEETISKDISETEILEQMKYDDCTRTEAIQEILFMEGTTINEEILTLERCIHTTNQQLKD